MVGTDSNMFKLVKYKMQIKEEKYFPQKKSCYVLKFLLKSAFELSHNKKSIFLHKCSYIAFISYLTRMQMLKIQEKILYKTW